MLSRVRACRSDFAGNHLTGAVPVEWCTSPPDQCLIAGDFTNAFDCDSLCDPWYMPHLFQGPCDLAKNNCV